MCVIKNCGVILFHSFAVMIRVYAMDFTIQFLCHLCLFFM